MALAILTKADRRVEAEQNTYGLPQGGAIRRALKGWFRSQRDAVLVYLRTGKVEQKDVGDVPSIPDFDVFGLGDGPMSQVMTPLLEAIWDESGQEFMGRVGLDPDEWSVTNLNLRKAIEDAAFAFSASTNETTKQSIQDAVTSLRTALAEGIIDRGESLDQLTKRVKEIFSDAATWRARRIAASEASRAVHAAQEKAAYQSGVVTGWKWLLSSDACSLCQAVASSAPFVKLGQPFAVVGDNPIYSTVRYPPLHPSCQCTVVEVLDTDEQPEWSNTLIQPEPKSEDMPPEEANP